MKFVIKKTSDRKHDPAQPHDKAVRGERQTCDPEKSGVHHIMVPAWLIEVNTIAELMQLIADVDDPIIIHPTYLCDDLPTIEIYDDYRE